LAAAATLILAVTMTIFGHCRFHDVVASMSTGRSCVLLAESELTFSSIAKRYGTAFALEPTNLSIRAGEPFAVPKRESTRCVCVAW
jgi:hypothetical protein